MTTGESTESLGAPDSAEQLQPVPITPADACRLSAGVLQAAAEQLRDYAVAHAAGTPLPPELRRQVDRVGAGSLYAVAEWLDARAGLFGADARQVDVVGFDR